MALLQLGRPSHFLGAASPASSRAFARCSAFLCSGHPVRSLHRRDPMLEPLLSQAAALMAQAPELLAQAPVIEPVDVIAAKLPG